MRRRSSAVPPDISVDPFGKRRLAAFRERTRRRHAPETQVREHGLAGGYALIYFVLRNRLLQLGETQSRFAIEQAQVLHESFGAIKEIIVLQAQNFFRRRFERASNYFSRAAIHTQVAAEDPRYLMECVAAVGLVCLALVLGGREDGVGPWLGR